MGKLEHILSTQNKYDYGNHKEISDKALSVTERLFQDYNRRAQNRHKKLNF